MLEILFLVAVGTWVWFQFDSMRAREIATQVAREYCKRGGLQFLDGSVQLQTRRFIRFSNGLKINRRFSFDYTDDVESRLQGVINMNGKDVEQLNMSHESPVLH